MDKNYVYMTRKTKGEKRRKEERKERKKERRKEETIN